MFEYEGGYIEVWEDLTTHGLLDAFIRFVIRSGPCRDLYSDYGKMFIGANRALQEDLVAWQVLAQEGILSRQVLHIKVLYGRTW